MENQFILYMRYRLPNSDMFRATIVKSDDYADIKLAMYQTLGENLAYGWITLGYSICLGCQVWLENHENSLAENNRIYFPK